ncbi:hypothetical protein EOL32_26765, partial [Citrobacter freundii]
DLEFMVWQRLAGLAQRRGKTLSETIVQLIEAADIGRATIELVPG